MCPGLGTSVNEAQHRSKHIRLDLPQHQNECVPSFTLSARVLMYENRAQHIFCKLLNERNWNCSNAFQGKYYSFALVFPKTCSCSFVSGSHREEFVSIILEWAHCSGSNDYKWNRQHWLMYWKLSPIPFLFLLRLHAHSLIGHTCFQETIHTVTRWGQHLL